MNSAETEDIVIRKYKVGGQESSCIEQVTRNRACLNAVPRHINVTDLYE